MLVPTRRLLSIRRYVEHPRGVSLLVGRAPPNVDFQECGSGRRVCRTSRSLPQSVKRRPRRPLIGAGRRTTSPRLAGGSRWRRLSSVASKLLCVLRAAAVPRRRARRAGGCGALLHYRRGGVSSIASVLKLPRTPTGGCNACRAVASHLLRGPLGAALQSSDATKRGRASACNNDARCRLQRSEHSDATRSRLAKHASAMRDGKMVLTALHDSFVRF